MAAHLTSLLYGIPHVLTMHSLEPLRPWKAEQLGGGDALSSWCERDVVESAAAPWAVVEVTSVDYTIIDVALVLTGAECVPLQTRAPVTQLRPIVAEPSRA